MKKESGMSKTQTMARREVEGKVRVRVTYSAACYRITEHKYSIFLVEIKAILSHLYYLFCCCCLSP